MIDVQRRDQSGRGGFALLRKLVQHARLGQRERGLQQPVLEQADAARIKARETAYRADTLFEGGIGHHGHADHSDM